MQVVWLGEAVSEEVRHEPGEPEGVVLSGKATEVSIDIQNRSDKCGWDCPHCLPCLNPNLAPDLAQDDIVTGAAVQALVIAVPQPN